MYLVFISRCLWQSLSSALRAVLGKIIILPIMGSISNGTSWQVIILHIQALLEFLEPRPILPSRPMTTSASELGDSVVTHLFDSQHIDTDRFSEKTRTICT